MRPSLLSALVLVAACASQPTPNGPLAPSSNQADAAVGVLVMAHGGSPDWNRDVADAVAPLSRELPTAVAYGMADPVTLSAALDSLQKSGVTRVAVVRMFLSGESFSEQTAFYLGLSSIRPAQFVLMGSAAADPNARLPIEHGMSVATHAGGILDSPEAGHITAERARALSRRPADESVLLIAHGMGAEDQNDRVLAAMAAAADSVRSRGFANVAAMTLREDWEASRVVAEDRIRAFVDDHASQGHEVIVVPMRLSGFGPYAEVLSGLTYSQGEGLLPHDAISAWVRRTAIEVICSAGWGPVLGACPRALASPNLDDGQLHPGR